MQVKLHDKVRPDYLRWRQALSTDATEGRRLARQFWSEFVTTLTTAGGPPPGSVASREHGSGWYWVEFPPHYIALVQFRSSGGLFGWFVRRKAVVTRIVLSPGPSA
jgi:hypothetical protein